jgi:hypothetical protein
MYSVHQPLSRIQFYVSKTVESDLCSAIVAGTAMVGIKIQDKVVIVDTPKSGDVINPRLTGITKSAIHNTFQTTRVYFD